MLSLLIVVDMQNDFVTKGGALYFESAERVKPVVKDIVSDRMSKAFDLIFTKDWHKPDDLEFNLFPPHCIEGSYGSELFDDLKAMVNDFAGAKFVFKRRFSAFYGTDFDRILQNLSPKTVEICGVDTNICVMYTVEELRNRDYDVIVYEDGTGSYDDGLHSFAISQMRDVLGCKIKRWR
jgi:nicotinamidase/pyrazinamidase